MTQHRAHTSLRPGFTLIELLIVISIIALLAGLGFAGMQAARETARKASSKKAMADLIIGSDNFYDSYNYLPLSTDEDVDTLRKTDNELMAVLVGLEDAEDENPRLESFFTAQKAKGQRRNAFNGLYRTETEAILYGPWRLKNEDEKLYRIIYNYDFDDYIEETEDVGNERIYNRRQIAYILGRDGEAGGSANADNVYSYK